MSQTIEIIDGMLKFTTTTTSTQFITKTQMISQIAQKTTALTNLQGRVSALIADIANDQANLDSLG